MPLAMVCHLGSPPALVWLTVTCRGGDSEADDLLSRQHGSSPPSRYPSRSSSPSHSPEGPKHLFRTNNWSEYPERFFPNWVSAVQDRCGMSTLFEAVDAPRCRVYPIELGIDNRFHQAKTVEDHTSLMDPLRPTNEFAQFLDCKVRGCFCISFHTADVLNSASQTSNFGSFVWRACQGVSSRCSAHSTFPHTPRSASL